MTDAEKERIKGMIDRDEPLPVDWISTLFPHGSFDKQAYERDSNFSVKFTELPRAWINPMSLPEAIHAAPNIQAAWPWRREIWTVHVVCGWALLRAYGRYTTGKWARWTSGLRELERLYHLTSALTAHNGLEDRIAQLANCFNTSPQAENRVDFCKVFDKNLPLALPKTVLRAQAVRAHTDWKETHDRANTFKHRWTGEAMSQMLPPAIIRQIVDGTSVTWVSNDPGTINPEKVDRICEAAQRPFNLLVDLATVLDDEIGWG